MTKAQKAEQERAIAELHKHLKPGDTVYTVLDHVSRSGMSRNIRVLIPYTREDGSIDHLHPNYLVAQAIGERQAKRGDGIVMGGCGMDMGFQLVYLLSSYMFPDGFGCTGEHCPSNDHSNGDRDRRPHEDHANGRADHVCATNPESCTGYKHWHKSGGYAPKQRWL